jgi:hypothetical protein
MQICDCTIFPFSVMLQCLDVLFGIQMFLKIQYIDCIQVLDSGASPSARQISFQYLKFI